LKNNSRVRVPLLIVAISYFLFNVYQAAITTVFLFEFPFTLNQFISNQIISFNLPLLLIQEVSGSLGVYLRFVGGVIAVQTAWLFAKGSNRYFKKFRQVLLLESIYFLLLLPSGINHIITSATNPGGFFNIYTGISFLLQPLLIFPSLFMASRILKNSKERSDHFKWLGIAGIFYVFGLWIKHSLLWVYALVPLGNQQSSLLTNLGAVNSLLTLFIAAVISVFSYIIFKRKKKLSNIFVGTVLTLIGSYFVIYLFVSIWVPVYCSFLVLTEIWLIVLPILGLALVKRTIWT
jgi:hypothetical protein